MKNKPIKIPSFTLMDVLSGMVITSIIIGMVFSLFTVVNQQLYDYAKTRKALNQYLILKADLKRTICDPNLNLATINNELYFERYDSKIRISPSGSNLLRFTEGAVDTLTSQLEKFILLKSTEAPVRPRVESVHLEVLVNNRSFTCDFYRPLDNADQINKTILDGV